MYALVVVRKPPTEDGRKNQNWHDKCEASNISVSFTGPGEYNLISEEKKSLPLNQI